MTSSFRNTSETASTRGALVSDASGSWTSGFNSNSVFPVLISITMAAFARRERPENGSREAAAAAVWTSGGPGGPALYVMTTAPNASTARISAARPIIVCGKFGTASCRSRPSVSMSACIYQSPILSRRLVGGILLCARLERAEFGGYLFVAWQFFVVSYAEVSEKLDGGPIKIFARIFRIPRAFKEPPREQIAQGRGGIHAANVIYLGAGGGAAVEDDGKHLKPCLPYFTPQLT